MTLEQHRSRLSECESDIRSQLQAEQGAGALAKSIARRWVLHHRMRATLAPENLSTRQNDLSFRECAVQELIGVQGTYTTKLGQLIRYYLEPLRSWFVQWRGSGVDPNGWLDNEFGVLFRSAQELERCHLEATRCMAQAAQDESLLPKAFRTIFERHEACSRWLMMLP